MGWNIGKLSMVFQNGSETGTQRIFSSGPFSSYTANNPTGVASTIQPGKVGSHTNTRASRTSPSFAKVFQNKKVGPVKRNKAHSK